MKRILSAILAAAVLAAPGWSAVSAQEVSHLNQDMDNRPNLQSEQTVGGHTSAQGVSAQGVNLQNPQPSPQSRRRRPAKASKTPPHLPGPAACPPAHSA
jgi:hypothetical protein